MIVSIHQPNYIPWLGYFDKIHQSDIHVFLDDVEYSKNNFINRNKILMNGTEVFLTIPVGKKHHKLNINQITIEDDRWKAKHIKTLKQAYSKAPHYSLYIDKIESMILDGPPALSVLNSNITKWIASEFGISTEFIYSSQIDKKPSLKKTDLLIEILNTLSAHTYLTGVGAINYLDTARFNTTELKWQDFEHPVYRQDTNKFVKNMSALDLLFNEGPNSKGFFVNGL